jgi:protease-4
MSRAWVVGVAALVALSAAGCGTIVIAGPQYKAALKEAVVDGADGWWVWRKVALLDVDGVISDSESLGLLGGNENTVARFREGLQKAEDDWLVRAVVVRMNSPGGGVTASDTMYHELRAFRERTKKPVVVCITDIGASGGYYVALGGDAIVAHPTAVTGSIGVLVETFNIEGLLGKIGVTTEAIKSADKKDMASPLRPMTDDERKILQGIVNSMYGRFVQVVAERRPGLDEAAVRKLADGRVYTAEQALELKLVDQIGYLPDAIAKAKTLAGIRRAKVVAYRQLLEHKATIYSQAQPRQVNLLNIDLGKLATRPGPVFLYLWKPGE